MFWIVLIVDVDLLSLSLSLHVEHLVSLGHDGLGGGEGGVSSVLLSTESSSDSSLDYTNAEVFVDSACFFSMMMMVRVLRIVVVSGLPPIVELLKLGTCSHLVSLLLDVLEGGGGVVSSVLLSSPC
jgi:hypothetical protein